MLGRIQSEENTFISVHRAFGDEITSERRTAEIARARLRDMQALLEEESLRTVEAEEAETRARLRANTLMFQKQRHESSFEDRLGNKCEMRSDA